MPKPIADAGTLVLIIGGALGLDIVMFFFLFLRTDTLNKLLRLLI
jgi:hypothetical protein